MRKSNWIKAQSLIIALMMTAPHLEVLAQSSQKSAGKAGFSYKAPQLGVTDDNLGEPNVSTDDELAEPSIKLPPLPPRRFNPNQNPNLDGRSTPTGQASMGTIEKSAFPGMTCPLVDNRPNKDLLNAVQALTRVVVVTPECQNNSELVKMSDEAKKLVTAGTSLQELWNNPQTLVDNQKSLVDFQNNLGVMLTGINNVTTALQNNALLDSKCGKQMMTGTGVLVAVSDLINSFAPFALIGASMNPSLGAALPYILGFTGVGSVAKIIKNMSDANTLKMEKPEHRQAVLQNICEFSKISEKIRFLKLAQSGQLEAVTQEIQSLKKQADQKLRSRFSSRVLSIANMRSTAESYLQKATSTLKRDQLTMRSIQAQIDSQADDALVCFTAREVISRAGKSDAFPTRATENLKSLIEVQASSNLTQAALLSAEERLREKLNLSIKNDTQKGLKECAATGRAYLESLSRLLSGTAVTIQKLGSSLDKQLKKDPEYATFRKNEEAAKSEIVVLSKVASILEKLNLDNAIIDKMEMDTQIAGLKRALFGTPVGLPMIRGSSPAMAWLNFVDEQFARSVSSFNNEMDDLTRDAYRITTTGRSDFYKRDASGKILLDKFGYAQTYSKQEINEMMIRDLKSSWNLNNLTNELAPIGTENHQVVCQRLENIWLGWAAAMDHLAAEEFFCQNIKMFFDSSTESALISRCVGRRDLTGKILQESEIQKNQSNLAKSGMQTKALLVSKKMKSLSCEMPDAVEAMK